APASTTVVGSEVFRNLSSDPNNSRYVTTVLAESALVRVKGTAPTQRPTATIANGDDPADPTKYVAANSNGSDGIDITDNQIAADAWKAPRKGIYALDSVDLFNLLCIPPLTFDTDVDPTATLAKAAVYCKNHRAMLIVDPPSDWIDTDTAETGINTLRTDIGTD